MEQGAEVAPPVGVEFTLTVVNDTTEPTNVMIFPTAPAVVPGSPVVWRSFDLGPDQSAVLEWRHTLNFVRGTLTDFGPGQDYDPVQIVEAVPGQSNQVTLALVDGELALVGQQAGPPGTLLVVQDPSVPPGSGNVGVGIAGLGTFVALAEPGVKQGYGYAPQFSIGTGTYRQGQLFSTMGINTQAPLDYPGGATTATAVFDGTGWNISY
ncbi:hypothetical protein FHS29_003997 [Saccharothrix tamanrassetensis]|uniref:Uncharacterized protein n=1 Tax=Saccharothrix tamanrassetensis TaxID=1051531 RepID=A0A841CFU2_9PSEU|nr:hypothetical protein [Saccharothrix tamanrassetensis]MBB5957402.1 hypothetical protein [Saccharothrix tamanrassetensis]